MHANSKWNPVILQDVLHVPNLYRNLLSVPQLAKWGAWIQFTDTKCEIWDYTGDLICEGHCESNLYIINCKTMVSKTVYISIAGNTPPSNNAPSNTEAETMLLVA